MMAEETKVVIDHHQQQQAPPPQQHYGTFQGVANYPPQTVTGYPQPVPPPGTSTHLRDYQIRAGYFVADGTPIPRHSLPCCGLGLSWLLFILGFFLGTFPWFIGAIIYLCVRSYDHREKAGYIACTIAALLATIVIIFGMSCND